MTLSASCIVCGGNAYHNRVGGEPVCARAECRQVVSEKSRMNAFAYASYFAARANNIRERDRQIRLREDEIRLARERETAENRVYAQARIAKIDGYRAEKHPLLAVPHNARKLTNLPERRKRSFRDRLNRLISAVTEAPDAQYTGQIQPDPPHEAGKLLSGACALCAGACCLNGGDRAYLSELTLVRVMQAQPALRPRHLLDLYLSHLGKKTYENACVYQGVKGCVLPAELRSNVCFDYYCPPLQQFKRAFGEDEKPEGAVVVVRAREHWSFPKDSDQGIAGAFLLTEAGAERLD